MAESAFVLLRNRRVEKVFTTSSGASDYIKKEYPKAIDDRHIFLKDGTSARYTDPNLVHPKEPSYLDLEEVELIGFRY